MKLAPILREGDSDLRDALNTDPMENEIAKIKEKDPNWDPKRHKEDKARSNEIDNVQKEVFSMDDIEYEKRRKEIAKKLGFRVSVIDNMRPGNNGKDLLEEKPLFKDIEPWPEPVRFLDVLEEVQEVLKRFIIMDDDHYATITLWIVASWYYKDYDIFPYLTISSPEKRCGKSLTLRVISKMVDRPFPAANISPAGLFRTCEEYGPTLLIDEGDTFLKNNSDMLNILNAGHSSEFPAVRVEKINEKFVTQTFAVYCPKVIAVIGKLPDTLIDRSIIIPLQRKNAYEKVDKLNRQEKKYFDQLKRKISRVYNDFTLDDGKDLDSDNDREIDNWFPLLSVADTAGGHWPKTARGAAKKIGSEVDEDSYRIMLLEDFKNVIFIDGIDKESTEEIKNKLHALDERPWLAYGRKSKPISAIQIARLLKPFGIYSDTIRFDESLKKGYWKKHFIDAWNRYLSSTLPVQAVTTYIPTDTNGLQRFQDVTNKENVTDRNRRKATDTNECYVVTDKKGVYRGKEGNTAILDGEEYKEVDEDIDELF
jgi:hypothetical protein